MRLELDGDDCLPMDQAGRKRVFYLEELPGTVMIQLLRRDFLSLDEDIKLPRDGIITKLSAYESNRLARTGFEPVTEPTSLYGVTPSAVVVVATRGPFAF